MISEKELKYLYISSGKSMQETADLLHCSLSKVKYWMDRYEIDTRSRSEATYLKNNPTGDPFNFTLPKTLKDAQLLGIGLGLYWGEGTKADKVSVRLGNTDPALIRKFIECLVEVFSVKKEDMRFGLQLFTDTTISEAMDFWLKKLKIRRSQFYKVTITQSRARGTYRKKSRYGVLTVYYHNKKLRDLLVNMLPM